MQRTARALALVAILLSVSARAEDAAQLQLALTKLTHVGSALSKSTQPLVPERVFLSGSDGLAGSANGNGNGTAHTAADDAVFEVNSKPRNQNLPDKRY